MTERRLLRTFLQQRPNHRPGLIGPLSVILAILISAYYRWVMNPMDEASWVLRPEDLGNFNIEVVLKSLLAHGDWGHLLNNAFSLLLFGYLVSGYFGVFFFLLTTFVIGGLSQLITISFYPPGSGVLGISGSIYILAGAWCSLYFGIQRNKSVVERTLRILGMSTVILLPTTFDPQTSYLSHGVGYGVGLIWGYAWFLSRKSALRKHEIWEELTIEDPV